MPVDMVTKASEPLHGREAQLRGSKHTEVIREYDRDEIIEVMLFECPEHTQVRWTTHRTDPACLDLVLVAGDSAPRIESSS